MKIIDQSVRLISPGSHDDIIKAVKTIEYAGRTCYDSTDRITEDSYKNFIASLIRRKHDSPLEFCDIVLEMVTSRDVMGQWTRHRLVSNAIQSQRYVLQDGDGGIQFIRPCFSMGIDRKDGPRQLYENYQAWEGSCEACEFHYKQMISFGAKKEDARKVLNNSVATTIVTKMNARELRHLLSLRLAPSAYPEMRQLAYLILDEVKKIPVLFDDLGGDADEQ